MQFGLLLGCLAFSASAQEGRHAADRLPAILERVPLLRVDLKTTQERLVPGDTIPIAAAVYDASGKIFTRRQILHMDLVNLNGSIVHRQYALLADGTTDSYLAIPSTLPPGGYLLRAFTDFMRNYGEQSFFRVELEVVTDRALKRPAAEPMVRLYAEGGDLVAGVANRMIVRYQGLPLGSEIRIVSGDGKYLTSTFVLAAGVSTVYVVPGNNHIEAQHALVKSESLSTTTTNRVAMRCDDMAARNGLTILMPSSREYRRNQLAVILLGSGKVIRLPRGEGSGDSLRFTFPQNLTSGMYQAIALDEAGNELARRFFMVRKEQYHLLLNPEKKTLAHRESSALRWSVRDEQDRPVRGNFTAEIIDQRAVPQQAESSWPNHWLGPDLSGFVPVSNLSPNDQDLLLATRQESWLPSGWQATDYQPAYEFRKALHFSGSVNRTDGIPLRDSTSIMLFLQQRMLGYEVEVRNGRFDFQVLFDFRGYDELFYVVHRKDSLVRNVRILFDQDTVSSLRPLPRIAQYSRDPFADFIVRKRATEKSYRFFTGSRSAAVQEEPNPNLPFEKQLRGADATVRIDDYVVFPTVEDVVREIVPGLKHRKSGNRNIVRVFLYSPVVTNDPILSFDDPLYIIDGQMTRSTDYFLGLDPADLISISIVRNVQKLGPFGYLGRNGVVLVRTRKPRAIREFEGNTITNVQGLAEFWNGIPAPAQSPRVPDLRILLGRTVRLTSDQDGVFQLPFRTGDLEGTSLIRIKGYTDTGYPLYSEATLEVKSGN